MIRSGPVSRPNALHTVAFLVSAGSILRRDFIFIGGIAGSGFCGRYKSNKLMTVGIDRPSKGERAEEGRLSCKYTF
jgi:hypothetical protein